MAETPPTVRPGWAELWAKWAARAEARSDFVGRQPSSRQVPPNARASVSAAQLVDA
jgi:hypothetical protein